MSEHTGAARETLFREAALDRMASPERLQLAARIVRPASWLLLVAAAVAVVAAIWSSVLIHVPVRVHGSGMLLSEPGPRSVLAAADGRIVKILVAAGDEVHAGQALAVIVDSERTPQAGSESQKPVSSPADGVVGEILVGEGAPVAPGATLMTLIPTAARSAPLVAIFFLPPGEGKRLHPGMAATIVVASAKPDEYGGIVGRITRVAELPATAQGVAMTLRNQHLAASLAANGATMEVRAALETDPAAPSGYRWTSSRGPKERITMGTPCEADVVVESRRVMTLLMPAARRLFGE